MIEGVLMKRNRHMFRALIMACVLAVGLAACAVAKNPQDTATTVAKALYNNDYSGAVANFDDSLKSQATRTQVAMISDKMHALGDLQGLTETRSDADTRRFWYDAKFTNGDMTVEMRLHADGSVAAYRVLPQVVATPRS
jgi:hypothetical protein